MVNAKGKIEEALTLSTAASGDCTQSQTSRTAASSHPLVQGGETAW